MSCSTWYFKTDELVQLKPSLGAKINSSDDDNLSNTWFLVAAVMWGYLDVCLKTISD